jgi:hypothetical protein
MMFVCSYYLQPKVYKTMQFSVRLSAVNVQDSRNAYMTTEAIIVFEINLMIVPVGGLST